MASGSRRRTCRRIAAVAEDGARLASLIAERAFSLGFEAIGFAPARLGPETRERLAAFLAAGRHGTMDWMAARADERGDPRALWPEAATVIALGLSYAPAHDPGAVLKQPERGAISVYAQGRDYHDVVKGKLKLLAGFVVSLARRDLGPPDVGVKVFVDTAPVMEKPLAEAAGLGWQGKHTNLVSRDHGSWLFLGEILTTLPLPASVRRAGACGSCARCLAACPTDAFPAPYQLDATRCISYLTIEHAGPIPHALRERMGNRIYGCDDCLAACPWNRFAQSGREARLAARADLRAPALGELAALDDAAFRAMFSASAVKRIGRDRFVRNVLIAIGNSGDRSLLPAAERLRADPDPVIAEAASWAVGRLEAGTARAA